MTQEALEDLLKALPRCCNCQTAAAVVIDFYRWPLCEACWVAVPGSDDEIPLADMREAARRAQKALRTSLTDSLSRIPTVNEIPPPSDTVPDMKHASEQLEELEKSLRMARRRYREQRRLHSSAVRRVVVIAFLLGVFFSAMIFAAVRG